VLSLPLLPPQGEDSSHSSPAPASRFLSQETVLHKLLQPESFLRSAGLHKLPQCGSFPQGAVLQEQATPAWVPHGVTNPARKPAPVWAPLSTGPQVLAGACSSVGSPWDHSFLQASTCSGVGSLPRVQVDICSTLDLHGLQGDSLPHHGLHHKLQGKTFCSGIWSTSFPLLLH